MVNMPDSVKIYILEKNNEMKSGENNYKIQNGYKWPDAIPLEAMSQSSTYPSEYSDIT